jgi:hypothetical protein
LTLNDDRALRAASSLAITSPPFCGAFAGGL